MPIENVRNSTDNTFERQTTHMHPDATPAMPHSQSLNTVSSLHDYMLSDPLLAGFRSNGRMSSVRRFFCLFVTFDLLFTGLLWLSCVMLKGENVRQALLEQIYHYDIHTSMFDVVLVALCRFSVLLLFYAVMYINHWIVISLSTALTSMFLISKVYLYDWPQSSQPIFEVLIVIASFILCWGEMWFLDFRVLPQEAHASRFLISNIEAERAPLIQSYVNALPSIYTESNANFYSPMMSREGSILGFGTAPLCNDIAAISSVQPATVSECAFYQELGAKTLLAAWELHQNERWTLKKIEKNCESSIYVLTTNDFTAYKLTTRLETNAKFILDELFYNVDEISQWNKAVIESSKIQTVDEHTDICYQVSAEKMNGMISSRDFVTLRHWNQIEDCYIIATVATTHAHKPHTNHYVRAEHRIGCMVIQPEACVEHNGIDTQCLFHWILNVDLHLRNVPQMISEKALIRSMLDFVISLRAHLATRTKDAIAV